MVVGLLLAGGLPGCMRPYVYVDTWRSPQSSSQPSRPPAAPQVPWERVTAVHLGMTAAEAEQVLGAPLHWTRNGMTGTVYAVHPADGQTYEVAFTIVGGGRIEGISMSRVSAVAPR